MNRQRRGISVASILLLTAVVAVYAAGIASIRSMENPPSAETTVALLATGFLFGSIAGLVVGAFCGNRGRDALLGLLAGGLFGPPSVLLVALPESLPVVMVGGAVLVAFASAVRFFSPRDRGEGDGEGED